MLFRSEAVQKVLGCHGILACGVGDRHTRESGDTVVIRLREADFRRGIAASRVRMNVPRGERAGNPIAESSRDSARDECAVDERISRIQALKRKSWYASQEEEVGVAASCG